MRLSKKEAEMEDSTNNPENKIQDPGNEVLAKKSLMGCWLAARPKMCTKMLMYNIFMFFAALMVVIVVSAVSLALASGGAYAEPNVIIKISTDKSSYYPGETVEFTALTYFNNILVISVPVKLEVTDPLDNTYPVQLTGYTNGEYRGKFSSFVKGEHIARATAEIDGKEAVSEARFQMVAPNLKMELSVPDMIEYDFGPVRIEGNLSIADDTKSIDQKVQLFVATGSSPFYNNLCDVQCAGRCSFSCSLEQNIELSDYIILAKTVYGTTELTAKDSFRIELPETDNLKLVLEHSEAYLIDEAQVILLNATLNGQPVRQAVTNLKIRSPTGRSHFVVCDEIAPGIYSGIFKGKEPGKYLIQGVLSKERMFGSSESEFIITEKPAIIVPAQPERAVDIDTGKSWLLSEIESEGEGLSHLPGYSLDLTLLLKEYDVNTSEVYLISGHRRVKIAVTRSVIPFSDIIGNLGTDITERSGYGDSIADSTAAAETAGGGAVGQKLMYVEALELTGPESGQELGQEAGTNVEYAKYGIFEKVLSATDNPARTTITIKRSIGQMDVAGGGAGATDEGIKEDTNGIIKEDILQGQGYQSSGYNTANPAIRRVVVLLEPGLTPEHVFMESIGEMGGWAYYEDKDNKGRNALIIYDREAERKISWEEEVKRPAVSTISAGNVYDVYSSKKYEADSVAPADNPADETGVQRDNLTEGLLEVPEGEDGTGSITSPENVTQESVPPKSVSQDVQAPIIEGVAKSAERILNGKILTLFPQIVWPEEHNEEYREEHGSLDNHGRKVLITVYNPLGYVELSTEIGINESYSFVTDGTSHLGGYTYIITAVAGSIPGGAGEYSQGKPMEGRGSLSETAEETSPETSPETAWVVYKGTFEVLSVTPSVRIRYSYNESTFPNSRMTYRHEIKNNNYGSEDIIDLYCTSNFTTVLLYGPDGKTLLTDTNGNGARDTGAISAGGSTEIFVEVVVPPNVAVGMVDTLRLEARSGKDSSAAAETTDTTNIVVYKEKKEELKKDLEVISISEIDGALSVRVKNNDVVQRIAKVSVELNSSYSESGIDAGPATYTRLLEPGAEEIIIHQASLPVGYIGTAWLSGEEGQEYSDDDNTNNYKKIVSDTSWHLKEFNARIPIPMREIIGKGHDEFNVKAFVDLKDYAQGHSRAEGITLRESPDQGITGLRPVLFDGKSPAYGDYKIVGFDSTEMTGMVILHFRGIEAYTSYTAYIYYNSTDAKTSSIISEEGKTGSADTQAEDGGSGGTVKIGGAPNESIMPGTEIAGSGIIGSGTLNSGTPNPGIISSGKLAQDFRNRDFETDKIINNNQVKVIGRWVKDNQAKNHYGSDYLHDLNMEKGWKSVSYSPSLEHDNYEIYAYYPSYESFSSKTPVLISGVSGTDYIELNQQVDGGKWNYIGAYDFDSESCVSIGNYGTDGIVVADALMFRKVSFYSAAGKTQTYIDWAYGSDDTEKDAEEERKTADGQEKAKNKSIGDDLLTEQRDAFDLILGKENFSRSSRINNSDYDYSILGNYSILDLKPFFAGFENLSYQSGSSIEVRINHTEAMILLGQDFNGSGFARIYDNSTILNVYVFFNSTEINHNMAWAGNLSNRTANITLNLAGNLTENKNLTINGSVVTANCSNINITDGMGNMSHKLNASPQSNLSLYMLNQTVNATEHCLTTENTTSTANADMPLVIVPKQQAAKVGSPVRWETELDTGQNKRVKITSDARAIKAVDEKGREIPFNFSVGGNTITKEGFEKLGIKADTIINIIEIRDKRESAGLLSKMALFVDEVSEQRKADALDSELADELPGIALENETELIISRGVEKAKLYYETAAPKIKKESIKKSGHTEQQQVKVYSNVSVHYYNVTTETDISEAKPEQVRLYWNINSSRIDVTDDARFNVTKIDSDGNGLVERLRWITPKLSEQSFTIEIDLTILNIQSYPTLYRNWTVRFNTTGQANLTISASDGTSWSEFWTDSTTSGDDLDYLSLYCGRDEVTNKLYAVLDDYSIRSLKSIDDSESVRVRSLFYPGWECAEEAHLENRIITTGKHVLRFEFGNDVEYANNMGFLLYETFDGYANNTDAEDFVDYTAAFAVADKFSTYENASGDKAYRFNRTDTNMYYSEYNGTNVFGGTWRDYEVRTKFRMYNDTADRAIGIIVYSHISNGNNYHLFVRAKKDENGGVFQVKGPESGSHLCGAGSASTKVPDVNETWNMKARVSTLAASTRVTAKIWRDNETEPAVWEINTTCFDAGVGFDLFNGTAGLWAKNTVADFDYIIVENMSWTPVITVLQPNLTSYAIGEMVWFNISTDKTGKNCSYIVDGSLYNLTKANDTFFYANRSFSTYGVRNVNIYCDDYFGNTGTDSVSFNVGSGRVTILSPLNETITDYTPLLSAVFNQSYESWYRLDLLPESGRYGPSANLTLTLGPLNQSSHTITVYANDSGFIDNSSVSFAIDVPTPTPNLVIDHGGPKYTPDALVDLGAYGSYVNTYRFSCNATAWTDWLDGSGSNPDWYDNFDITNTTLGCNASLGKKIIYMQARNYFNETSATVNDTIIWDPDTLAGSSFTEYYLNTDYINASDNVSINVSASGRMRLESSCVDSPSEAGCWMYRLRVDIDEEKGTDYSDGVEFNVSLDGAGLIEDGKIQNYFEDLRVVRLNETGGLEQVFFWFDNSSCNTSDTKVWFNLSIGAYGSETYYVYYGNPAASASSYYNGTRVFRFFDGFDFEDSSKFTYGLAYDGSNPILYSVSNSLLGVRSDNSWRILRMLRDFYPTDYIAVGTKFMLPANTQWHQNYFVQSGNTGRNRFGLQDADTTQFRAQYRIDGIGSYIYSSTIADLDTNVWYTNELQKMSAYDFEGLFYSYDSGFLGSFATSNGGWADETWTWVTWQYENQWVYYDYIYVRKLGWSFSVSAVEEADYESSGYALSDLIRPAGIKTWKYLRAVHEIPEGTNISYHVLDETDSAICSFTVAEPIEYYDISGCAYGYEKIKVLAELSSESSFLSPAISRWTVSWIIDSDVVLDEPDDIYLDRYSDFYANGSVYANIAGCDIDAYLQYKLSGQTSQFAEDSYPDFITYDDYINISIGDDLRLVPDLPDGNLVIGGWDERFAINVSLNETRTDYVLMIDITSSDIDFSDTDFTDLRFTYYNASADKEINISHYLETANSTNTIIWVKVPLLTTSNTTILMYYDNPDAEDTSSGEDVFLLFDDFSGAGVDGSKWSYINSGTGSDSVSNGIISITSAGDWWGNSDTSRIIYSNTQFSSDYVYETKVIDAGTANWNRFMGLRASSATNSRMAYMKLDSDQNELTTGWRTTDGANAAYQGLNIQPYSEPFIGKITKTGSTIRYYYNDNYMNTRTVTNLDYVALTSTHGGTSQIDWARVRPSESDEYISKIGSLLSYSAYGNYTSDSFDTGLSSLVYGDIRWSQSLPSGTSINVYTRTSDDDAYWDEWQKQVNGRVINNSAKRYIQYYITAETTIPSNTPLFDNLIIEYSESSPYFIDASPTDTTLSANNPYSCGAVGLGSYCYPEWNNVNPKKRGMLLLRIHANSSTCSYDEFSNEKIVYVFADTKIADFQSDTDPTKRNQTITFSGRLQDADLGDYLASKTINFYDGNDYIGYAVTNSEGIFSFPYTVPEAETLGIHQFKAAFEKDYEQYYNPTEESVNVRISSEPLIQDLVFVPSPSGNGEPVGANVNVTDVVSISSVIMSVQYPDTTTENFSMSPVGVAGNYTYLISGGKTWGVGAYTVTITAENVDGITSQLQGSFTVQINGISYLNIERDSYKNYEKVFITTETGWWNTSWAYRNYLNISVSSGQTPKDYEVKLELDDSNIGANFWSDMNCTDVRFINISTGNELPYWIQECNTTARNAVIWVKIDDNITSSGIPVYMYYGNSGAADNSDETEVFDALGNYWQGWKSYQDASCSGPAGWTDTDYDDSSWSSVADSQADFWIGPPDDSDIRIRKTIVITEVGASTVRVRSDDGQWIYTSNGYVGHGGGECHLGGTASIIWTITDYLEKGDNTIAVHCSERQGDDYCRVDMWTIPNAYLVKSRSYSPYVSVGSLETNPAGIVVNTGSTTIRGYRWANVQRWTGSAWSDINPAVINDYAFGNLKTISSGQYSNFATDWNANAWNTTEEPPGLYRLKIALVKNSTTPQSEASIVQDSEGNKLAAYYNFTIIEAELMLANLTHTNLYESSINEYETTDTIDWINLTLKSINNTAFDANVTLTLLDNLGIDYVGFGPFAEKKNYGTIMFNTTKTVKWDNSSSGYYIPKDAVSGSYSLNWNISMVINNGPALLNDSEYIYIHNIPSNFSTTALQRLYVGENTLINMTIVNLWGQKITNASITINCPNITGLNCSCALASQHGSYCNLGNVSSLDYETSMFNLTANPYVLPGDYYVNFTVNYTNPAEINKSWQEVMNTLLEIRQRGTLEIFDYYHNATVNRGELAYFRVYANNTNGTAPAENATLNYTSVPLNWTNITGGLEFYVSMLNPDDIMWNNVTFRVGYDSVLGPNTVSLKTSSDNIRPDFKELSITVYANTSFSDYYSGDLNASRGETITLTAVLRWDNATPLSGRTVYFYDETDDKLIGSAVTNSAGTATHQYPLDGTTSLGLHTLNVTYLESGTIYTRASYRDTLLDVGLKPAINEVSDSPDPIGYGMNITLSANVTDDDLVDSAKAYIYSPNGSVEIIPLAKISADIFRGNYSNTWQNGTYKYSIWANDTTGSIATTANYTFTLAISGSFVVVTDLQSYPQFENVTLVETGSWWNYSFPYRQKINLSMPGDTTPENYQVQVILTQSDVGSNFNWSRGCADIRFANGSDNLALNYWVETCNQTVKNASVWVNVTDAISSAGHTIYMYYGNPDAVSESNINKTMHQGMRYYYYDTNSFTTLHGSDIDTATNWNWGNGVASINGNPWENQADSLSIRWEGWVIPDGSGLHTFYVYTDDGSRLYIDNQKIVDLWTPTPAVETPGFYTFSTIKTIKYEWYENGGQAVARLGWDPPDSGKVYPIPPSNLRCRTPFNSTAEPDVEISQEERLGLSYIQPNIRGHLMMKVQKYSSGSWVDIDTHIDHYSGSQFTATNNNVINLSSVWNPDPWNTANNGFGTYRVYAYMLTPYGEMLNTADGPLEGYGTFTIEPPAVNVTIDNIRIYELNSTNRYTAAPLYDSGLAKTFTLFVNKSYRVEVETKNNVGSADWNLSNVNVSHSGLNESWFMSPTLDIWYKIGAGSNIKNGSWTEGNVSWNNSVSGGIAAENTKVTFSYAFNTTPETTTGDYPVLFSLNDPTFTNSDSSVFHIVVESSDAPKIWNNVYNITKTEVIRTFNSTTIYGRWDQEIDEAKAVYNATTPGLIEADITLPTPNPYNWTNRTFSPTATWLLGQHVARIRAKNPSDVWNNTLQFLNFSVFGLSYVKTFSINESTPGIGNPVTIICGIEDDTVDSAISGYNITIYSNEGLINWSLSNSSGMIEYEYTPPTVGIYNIICNISEQGWYKTDSRFMQSDSIFVKEFEPPKFFDVSGPALAHKTDTVTLATRWTDNAQLKAALLATNASGSIDNVSDMALGGTNNWSNFSYTIPSSFVPGYLGWQQHANDTSDNYNTTYPLQTIEVWGWADVSYADVTPGSLQITNYTTATCRVVDSNSSSGIENYNVSYYRGSTFIGWNTTNATGYATYSFNNSPLGFHIIYCNITDQAALFYNASSENTQNDTLFVTLSPDVYPPYALTYDIDNEEVARGACVEIYAQWNEQINYSRAQYNVTTPITSKYITPPYTANWTNYTVCTNNSWSVGVHSIKLWVNDSIGNINDTAPYLNFNMTGWSRVAWMAPTGTMTRGLGNLRCNVTDTDTNESIAGYTIVFWGPEGFIGSEITNTSGVAVQPVDTSNYSTGQKQFQCQIVTTDWYTATTTLVTEKLDLFGILNVTIDLPTSNDRLYRGQLYYLNSTTIDDNNSIVEPDNASWFLNCGTNIANGSDANWTVPANYTIGYETINITVNKSLNKPANDSSTFEVWAWVQLNQSWINPSTVDKGKHTMMACQVVDYNISEPLQNVNVTFEGDTPGFLGWNFTNASGWATLMFNYSTSGYENITCRVADQQFCNATGSTWLNESLTITEDLTPPALLEYGLNATDIMRTECFNVYGRWDEDINASYVVYNKTSVFTNESIPPPFINRWTNRSICTDATWLRGNHSVKLWANDSKSNANNTVPYITIAVRDYAHVIWESPTGELARSISNITLTCNVTDNFTDSGIQGYEVGFYGPKGFIANSTTDVQGKATATINTSEYTVGEHLFFCNITDQLYYHAEIAAGDHNDSELLRFNGTLSTTIIAPSNGDRLYRGQLYLLNTTTYDENNTEVQPDNASWLNSIYYEIATMPDTNWTLPATYPAGNETINVTVEKAYYANSSDSVEIEVWAWIRLNQSNISNASVDINQKFNISCQVVDFNSSSPQKDVNVTFHSPTKGIIGWNITKADGWANITYSYDVLAYENISCRIADQQYFNVTGTTELNETINVTQSGVDMALESIVVPQNKSCTYNPEITIRANVTNLGAAVAFVNVTLYLDGKWNHTQQFNFSLNQDLLVNFTKWFYEQRRYNISVVVFAQLDNDRSNDNKTIYFDKYFLNLSVDADIVSFDENMYNVSIIAYNPVNCTVENASVYSFVPEQMTLYYNSTGYNQSEHIETAAKNGLNGKVYVWERDIIALRNISYHFYINGSGDFNMRDAFIIGLDPVIR